MIENNPDTEQNSIIEIDTIVEEITQIDTLLITKETDTSKPFTKDSVQFVNLKTLSNDFLYDIKYATEDNFLKQAVYYCPECYLRQATATALVRANKEFIALGYRIKIFDCYRPLDVQKKMWAILPGTNYVANPKKGSKHNRGAAVDLTLVDSDGNEIDMGTPFDFFGKEAHHTYNNLPQEVIKNRLLLKNTMHKYNFKSIYSEWWHYEYIPERNTSVENYQWPCN